MKLVRELLNPGLLIGPTVMTQQATVRTCEQRHVVTPKPTGAASRPIEKRQGEALWLASGIPTGTKATSSGMVAQGCPDAASLNRSKAFYESQAVMPLHRRPAAGIRLFGESRIRGDIL